MKTDFFTRSFDTGRHEAYDKLVDKVMSIITDPKQMESYSSPDHIAEVGTKPPPTEKINSGTLPARMRRQPMPCVLEMADQAFRKAMDKQFFG